MRLIDADKFKSYIDCGHLRSPTEVCFSELDVCNMIDKAPTELAEAVQSGEWIMKHDGVIFKRTWGVCSCCGNTLDFDGLNAGRGDANFCPNCGAKMGGGAE